MTFSVRCHAVIESGNVHSDVVITYEGSHAPSQYIAADTVRCKEYSLMPFTAETHSTVDYNGIAVIGVPAIQDIKITLDNLPLTIRQLVEKTSDAVPSDQGCITFYLLG